MPSNEKARLWCRGLKKIYGKRRVVDDVSLEIEQGETVGLLGPNGAGKHDRADFQRRGRSAVGRRAGN